MYKVNFVILTRALTAVLQLEGLPFLVVFVESLQLHVDLSLPPVPRDSETNVEEMLHIEHLLLNI